MPKSNTLIGKTPTHIAYIVNKGGEKLYWKRIGVVFPHKDEQGFNIVITLLLSLNNSGIFSQIFLRVKRRH